MRRTSKAFTLIELLVVIAVIGVLATLAFINVSKSTRRARNASAYNTVSQVQLSMGMFNQTAQEIDSFVSNKRIVGDPTDYLHDDGTGTIPDVFTGTQRIFSYATKITQTPGKGYEYSYYAPPRISDGTQNREILYLGTDRYAFCAKYLDVDTGTPQQYCIGNNSSSIPGRIATRNYDLGPMETAFHEAPVPGWILGHIDSPSGPWMTEPFNLACVEWGYNYTMVSGTWVFYSNLASPYTDSVTNMGGHVPCWRGWQSGPDIECGQSPVAGEGECDLAYFYAGEWLNYTANVTSGGNYKIEFRVSSSGVGGVFHLEADGSDITGMVGVPDTGGWQTYTTVSRNASLTAGTHVFKLVADGNGGSGTVGNVAYMTFTKL